MKIQPQMEKLHTESGVRVARPQGFLVQILNALVLIPGKLVDGRRQVQAVAVVGLPGEVPGHAFQPGVAERLTGAFAVGAGGFTKAFNTERRSMSSSPSLFATGAGDRSANRTPERG
jgi:hypothetical protein